MSEPIKRMGMYVRDLLNVPETIIKLGRVNNYDDMDSSLIVIDGLAPAIQQNVIKTFDGVNEIMTIDTWYREAFTINFYGDNSWSNSSLFISMNNTEDARTLQKTHQISVQRVRQVTNLKRLAGKKYDSRYEIEVNASYNVTNTIERLRFDTAQFDEILIDK